MISAFTIDMHRPQAYAIVKFKIRKSKTNK